MKLDYGYSDVVPDDANAAWGARLIVKQDGYVDFVPDRQDLRGDDDAKRMLVAHLEEVYPLTKLKKTISDLLAGNVMSTRTDQEFMLFADAKVGVFANAKASAGYCYVVAYLKSEWPNEATATMHGYCTPEVCSDPRHAW